jgi:hypothetical protein
MHPKVNDTKFLEVFVQTFYTSEHCTVQMASLDRVQPQSSTFGAIFVAAFLKHFLEWTSGDSIARNRMLFHGQHFNHKH